MAGFYRPSRHGALGGELIVAGDPPRMPEWLSAEAQLVWEENLGRVMAGGCTERDSDAFASYCELAAAERKAWRAGEVPPAGALTELRKMREALRIMGPSSRIGEKAGGPKTNNPFVKIR